MPRKIAIISSLKDFEKFLKSEIWVEFNITYYNLADIDRINVKAKTVHDDEYFLLERSDHFNTPLFFDKCILLKKSGRTNLFKDSDLLKKISYGVFEEREII